jgi:hypothetical protein
MLAIAGPSPLHANLYEIKNGREIAMTHLRGVESVDSLAEWHRSVIVAADLDAQYVDELFQVSRDGQFRRLSTTPEELPMLSPHGKLAWIESPDTGTASFRVYVARASTNRGGGRLVYSASHAVGPGAWITSSEMALLQLEGTGVAPRVAFVDIRTRPRLRQFSLPAQEDAVTAMDVGLRDLVVYGATATTPVAVFNFAGRLLSYVPPQWQPVCWAGTKLIVENKQRLGVFDPSAPLDLKLLPQRLTVPAYFGAGCRLK